MPDEPLFTLLARDASAPLLTELWAHVRAGNAPMANIAMNGLLAMADMTPTKPIDDAKITEAIDCAAAMRRYYRLNQ